MSWRPSPIVVWALAALVVMLGGWVLWTAATTDPLEASLLGIAATTPIEGGFGASVDVSERVCPLVDEDRLARILPPVVTPEGQRTWQFRHSSWLICMDVNGNRMLWVAFEKADQCKASVSVLPACEL